MGVGIHTMGPVARGYPQSHQGRIGSQGDELEALVYIYLYLAVCKPPIPGSVCHGHLDKQH